jgi:bifunctional non-homologous end joining protein LigD
MERLTINKRTIEIGNPTKTLFPDDGITKGDLINYYQAIAPYMLPLIEKHLISMQRFPNGIDHEGFYQKDAGSYFPSWIATKKVTKKEGGAVNYVAINNAATLIYLANQGCITPHIWLSKTDKLDYPDRMIFDLDPSGAPFSTVMQAARILRNLLKGCGLTPFLMTTGSQGLHVVVPLIRKYTFYDVRAFAETLASILALGKSDLYTTELRKEKRENRVFIDYLRNSFGATAVAPYAVRPLPGAPVATPISWSELRKGLTSQKYTIKTVMRALKKRGDPWKDWRKQAGPLPFKASEIDKKMKDPNYWKLNQE